MTAGGGPVDLNASGNLVNFNGNVGALVKSGNGTMVMTGNNTYTGGTTLAAGALTLGGTSPIGSGALTLAGGTLQATAAGSNAGQPRDRQRPGDRRPRHADPRRDQ